MSWNSEVMFIVQRRQLPSADDSLRVLYDLTTSHLLSRPTWWCFLNLHLMSCGREIVAPWITCYVSSLSFAHTFPSCWTAVPTISLSLDNCSNLSLFLISFTPRNVLSLKSKLHSLSLGLGSPAVPPLSNSIVTACLYEFPACRYPFWIAGCRCLAACHPSQLLCG